MLVYFTTRGLVAAWLLGELILRTLQVLWYRFLSCALRYSTVDHATTYVFSTTSVLHYLTVRYFASVAFDRSWVSLRICRLVRSMCSCRGRISFCFVGRL